MSLLTGSEHGDTAVCLWRQYIDQRIAVFVEGNTGTGLQQLSVNSGQYSYIVVGTCN